MGRSRYEDMLGFGGGQELGMQTQREGSVSTLGADDRVRRQKGGCGSAEVTLPRLCRHRLREFTAKQPAIPCVSLLYWHQKLLPT